MIRTFRYWLKSPIENKDLIWDQLRKAHTYRNVLVEIERGRRAALRVAMKEAQVAEHATLVEAADASKAAVEAMEAEVAAWRKKTRKRQIPEEMRTRFDDARIARRDAVKALSEAIKAAGASETLKEEMTRINTAAHNLRKNAREYAGLYWGTYLIVEEAQDAARKAPLYDRDGAHDPRFERWNQSGGLAVQIQNGLPTESVMASDTRVRIDPVPAEAWAGGRTALRMARTKLRMRIGTEEGGRAPIWGVWDMLMHKPLPPGKIKWVEVRVERLADRDENESLRWHAYFTVDVEEGFVHRHEPGPGGDVAVNIGWRLLEDGSVRVGTYVGANGEKGEMTIAADHLSQMRHTDSLQGLRAERMTRLKTDLAEALAAVSDLPVWIQNRTQYIAQWRGADRAHDLYAHWKENRFEEDESAYQILDRFILRDLHLWRWEAHERNKTRLRRKAYYQIFAANLARRFKTLILDDSNLAELAKKPAVHEEGDNGAQRSYRQMVAPHELRQCLIAAFLQRVSYGKSAHITSIHHACGSLEDFDHAAELVHTCSKCGATYDQDENAARNLLARFGSEDGSSARAVQHGEVKVGRFRKPKATSQASPTAAE